MLANNCCGHHTPLDKECLWCLDEEAFEKWLCGMPEVEADPDNYYLFDTVEEDRGER